MPRPHHGAYPSSKRRVYIIIGLIALFVLFSYFEDLLDLVVTRSPFDESRSQNVSSQSPLAGWEFPMLKPDAMRQCLAGKRVLFIGHSHINRLAYEVCKAMGYKCGLSAMIVEKSNHIHLRILYDGAVFGGEQPHATCYRNALRTGQVDPIAHRYDYIFITRSMWDIVFYDTHPKDLETGILDALNEVVTWLKPGGKMLFHTLRDYRTPSWPNLVPCADPSRCELYRTAQFSALWKFMEQKRRDDVSVNIYEMLPYTLALPRDGFAPDGNHFTDHNRQVAAEALVRHAFSCRTPGHGMHPDVAKMVPEQHVVLQSR